ncbi:hypothetical protein [Rhizobium sp. BK661]|uniref:hypothetical protein n=1 Tax=Rhizobium sp. BK661 TaxID=2586991 RepID=UPI0021686069|nr:hypothetical protein [Rhizobium sp. BK661]MCS3744304.1 hypothetical protein [Rhizobium sp. BK661]
MSKMLSKEDEEDLNDFIHFNGDEIAEEMGLVRSAPDNQFTGEDLERLFDECRNRFIASRPGDYLTEDERERIEMWLHDSLQGTTYDIAADLCLDPDGDWTDEEENLIVAEHVRRERPGIIALLLADRS